MSENESPSSSGPPLYTGGNEVFFSFLGELLESVDQGLMTQEALFGTLRRWGTQVAFRGTAGSGSAKMGLGLGLDWVGDALASLGLVRDFSPADVREGTITVQVLRCLIGRHVLAPRVRRGHEHPCLVAPVVQGMLSTLGSECDLAASREGMLRSDECLIRVMTSAGRRR